MTTITTRPKHPIHGKLACLAVARYVQSDETRLHLNRLFDALQYALLVNEGLFASPRTLTHTRLTFCHTWSELWHCVQTLQNDEALEALHHCLQEALNEVGWSQAHEAALDTAMKRADALAQARREVDVLVACFDQVRGLL